LNKIEQDFGETYSQYLHQQAKKYLDQNLLYLEQGKLLVTQKGKFLVDGIASDLFMVNLES
jgi:oxygen-independent coproporphyrinogen-3 oxidase